MRLCFKLRWPLIAMAMGLAVSPARSQTRDVPHVVAPEELRQDTSRVAQTRQANEAAIRRLLSSPAGQQALSSANVDYAKVDTAVGRLSDAEVARLADRSRQAERDFAAGLLSAKHLAELILLLVVIITIIVLV